ncbi:hypothetical protein ACE38W_11480 [Chitinophaga sp. Hz27]|uniref:hypothetical protein n=1 Tax=Chitinophaga sp. Hz27 TaxID=3347169 RepID=UPI0035D7E6D9
MTYTQAEIQELFIKFSRLGRYEDRLKLYDQYFNILPFTLPPFDTNLYNFFSDKNLEQFDAILYQERRCSIELKKYFQFEKEQYTFNIKPVNSNYFAINTYFIERFLHTKEYIFSQLQQDEVYSADQLLFIARDMVAVLEKKINRDLRRNALTQYATVFLKGLSDFNTWKVPSATARRKKIIELYMYAIGFLYGEYMHALQYYQVKTEIENVPVGIEEKLMLLQEFGFIDAIRNRFPFLNKADLDSKIAEIIHRITGEKISSFFGVTKRR